MNPESVLVVDDDPSILAICQRVLAHRGYDPKLADSGQAALRLAREQPFDLALIDINMPDLDGLDTYRQLRELQPDLIGVVVTGFATLRTAIEALELGFSHFVTKPFSVEHLASTVARALAKRRLERENERLRALLPLFDISRQMMSTTELGDLLPLVVWIARRETVADGAFLVLSASRWRRTREVPHPRSGVVQPADYRADPPGFLPLSSHAREQVMAGLQERLQYADFALLESDVLQSEWHFAAPLIACGIRSLLCVPLRIEDVSLGILCLVGMSSDVSFGEADRSFATVLASQAAVAIQNARLLGEIQQAYDELKQLDHMKSEFISIASHELRTPLSHIMGYANLLDGQVSDLAAGHLQVIRASAHRLRDLLNDMLNLRYLELRTSALRLEEVCLQEMIDALLDRIRPLAEAKRQQLVGILDPERISLSIDEEKLSLGVGKVLSNAVEFTPEGGIIEVRLRANGGWVLIGVRDSGIGIPSGELEHVFEPFYQVEESLGRRHEGIGLGLPIAKGMVELHGGRIDVNSEAGVGTLVTIRLPLQNSDQ
jgi:signal transduction histidine kinase